MPCRRNQLRSGSAQSADDDVFCRSSALRSALAVLVRVAGLGSMSAFSAVPFGSGVLAIVRRFWKRECKDESEIDPVRNDFQRRHNTVVPLSVFGGLLFVGYCFSRVRAKRGGTSDVQTLFRTKQHLN